jgi:hypothetical protein
MFGVKVIWRRYDNEVRTAGAADQLKVADRAEARRADSQHFDAIRVRIVREKVFDLGVPGEKRQIDMLNDPPRADETDRKLAHEPRFTKYLL